MLIFCGKANGKYDHHQALNKHAKNNISNLTFILFVVVRE
jgi:hypothetical protein